MQYSASVRNGALDAMETAAIRIWTLAANALADFPDVSVVIFR